MDMISREQHQRLTWFIDRQNFMKLIGFEITHMEAGRVEGWLDVSHDHLQQKGLLHGGVTATLADVVSGFAAYTRVGESEHVVTAELKISYLNPGTGDRIKAVGWVLKSGRRMHFCEAEVFSISGNEEVLIAKATSTMAVISESDLRKPQTKNAD